MTAYAPKDAGDSLDGLQASVGSTNEAVGSSSDLDTVATSDPSDVEQAGSETSDDRSSGGKGEQDRNAELGEKMALDADHLEKVPEELTKFESEDGVDCQSPDMLHYLGLPMPEGAGFGGGSNGDLTRERLRQLATARLAEQGQRAMNEANLLFQREAAAMQQKVNATVASKPLYSIGAPQRIRMPKQPLRYPEQLRRRPLYDGPLNFINRPVMPAHPYGLMHQAMDGAVDLSKPLDLSMKSDRLNAMSIAAKTVADPRLMFTKADVLANQPHIAFTNVHEMTSKVTSVQTMYRPPPMMSYGKANRHGDAVHSHPPVHQQHSLLPKDVPMSIGQLHPLASAGLGPLIQTTRSTLKRPAPVMVCSASGIPFKRTVHDSSLSQAKEQLKVVPSSIVPTSASSQSYQDALLAYKRGRSHAVALINQQSQDSPLLITDVRSIGPQAGTNLTGSKQASGQTRPRSTKTGSAPVFHHIHHHHHHHHVPQPEDELLHPGPNGTPGLANHAGLSAPAGVLPRSSGAVPANGIQTHEVPIHRLAGRGVPGHDATIHGMAAPNMTSCEDRGVLIKHASTPVSNTITSPHLRRTHYHTRRRYRSISPPTLRKDSLRVTSTPGRAHHHTRAASPLKLVASSIAAGAKMNELLKPLDGPEHPSSMGHEGVNNNNNKVLVTEKLARPLRVDIPDDRAFVSHIGGVYSGQANPVPLVRQVSNVASITKCLTSEVASSPKKSNSSGNESPTMPVLTPQSVYSPCFTTESATNLNHISSAIDSPATSSPLFYNALTLPLYPRKQDSESVDAGRLLPRAAKDESPPHLHETSPEQLVPDQHVPSQMDPDRRAERSRVESALQRQIDSVFLDAAAAFDKNKREHRRMKESLQEREAYQRQAYQQYMELCRGPIENKDRHRKRHTHSYGLKASMDKMKAQQGRKFKERKKSTESEDDRNIFAHLMLQRKWYGARTNAEGQSQQNDVIDLTTSPSSSPAPDVLGNVVNKTSGSGGIDKTKTADETKGGRNASNLRNILSSLGEEQTVSVSEAIDAVFAAHLPLSPSCTPHSEQAHSDSGSPNPDQETQLPKRAPRDTSTQKDHPPKLVKVLAASAADTAVSPSIKNVSPNGSSSLRPAPPFTVEGESLAETSLEYSNSMSTTAAGNAVQDSLHLSSLACEVNQTLFLGSTQVTHSMTSSMSSLPPHLRYSPTEKTVSHDPRKKLLAAMSVHAPTPCAVSPASVAASLCSTASPSSGRSTPSKSAARKRSLEISRLENTSSFVAEIPKRKQNVDLLTDPALLDREERALQRAMKRFNEMEKRERVTLTDTPTDTQTNGKRQPRLLHSKHSPLFRGGRGRGRKFMNCKRMHQMSKDELTVLLRANRGRRGFSREILRLNSHMGRNTFRDFVPMVLEERTRHSLATRSSARQRKAYHKNARYEMEIEKEEQKYLERKRQKRSVSGSTSGEDEASSLRSKTMPGRRRRGGEDALRSAGDPAGPVAIKKEPVTPTEVEVDAVSAEPHGRPPGTESGQASTPADGAATGDGAAGLDSPMHVVIDPKNLTKIKLVTSSAYQLHHHHHHNHRKDSGRDVISKDRDEADAVKPGGKRKFKAKHLEPATVTPDADVVGQEGGVTIKVEVLNDQQTAVPPPLPPTEPEPVKMIRPQAPAELKRLMVNKKLGETILHRAARLAYDDVAIYCIDYDVVDINAKDNAGYTPLHECCVHGRLRVALHLLQHGADVNASASDGTRPIHDAVDNNWLALVRLLLMYGADPLLATYSGRTTIRLARTSAMKTFIIGYLNDVNGDWELDEDDPYQSNLDLSWHLAGTHSFDANGLPVADIFQDVPEEKVDQPEEDFLVELSETPHLTSYNISLPDDRRARNWLLLSDVTTQLVTTRKDFLARHRALRRATLTCDEFAEAMKDSQLNCAPLAKSQLLLDNTSGNYIVEMLELTSELREILLIEEDYV